VAIIAAFMTSWIEHAKGLKLVRQSNEDCWSDLNIMI
jgi:hypothetical protein